jgi:spermidine/putrescine-binding protein
VTTLVSIGVAPSTAKFDDMLAAIEFVQTEEGFLLWSDNMQIPVGAPRARTTTSGRFSRGGALV